MDKYTLKTAFKKSFLGLIWRIEADTANGLIAVETRDEHTGTPTFSTLQYATGDSLIDEISYGDRHWTLAGMVEGKLILRKFGHHRPDSAGIVCIDALNGRVLWEQFNYVLLAVYDGEIIARHRNFADGYEQRLSIHHGILSQKTDSPNKPMTKKIVLPQHHTGNVPEFLENYEIQGDLLKASTGQRDIWAFHERDGQFYRVRLLVSDGLNVLVDEVVIPHLTKMTPELFFMIDNQIFLIGYNKRKIVSYLV